MEEIVRIPEERVGVIIGPKGSVRKKIEARSECTLEVDSEGGEVIIEGEGEGFLRAVSVVKAIARGFSPERAYKLFELDYMLRIIDITEYTGKNVSSQKAKRGRVIGRDGLARVEIEKKTHSLISVYGKTVAIIALPSEMESAVDAVDMLLNGAKHETMEKFLERETTEQFKL